MNTSPLSAIIIGAGFGGLAAAVELDQRGISDLVILERGPGVGGVWRDNTYPGAACDVPSSLYSFSFAPNPSWPRRYSQQPDILSYIEQVTAHRGLGDRVRTHTEVTSAAWDESSSTWQVETLLHGAPGPTYTADVLITAVGQLSRPALPRLEGLDSFAGPAFHSAEWDHSVDLTGKRVGVVGTGASAIQFVPEITKIASQVTVFQRSAPYVVPKGDRAYTRLHHWAFSKIPASQGLGREGVRFASEQLNEALAEQTGFTRGLELAFRTLLRLQIRDAGLRKRLTPDYPMGCKRLLFSNAWYPALAKPHVDVVTHEITEVTPTGLRTADGVTHDFDVLVYGTGFKATEFLAPMAITGRDGRSLSHDWADGARGHLGMTVPGYPNFFMVYGPNTNLGGSSILSMIECQTGYLGQAVDLIAAGATPTVEVRREVADRFDAEMQERLSRSVWTTGCTSWYQTASGRVTTNWPGQVQEYRERTATFDPAEFAAASTEVGQTAPLVLG